MFAIWQRVFLIFRGIRQDFLTTEVLGTYGKWSTELNFHFSKTNKLKS